MEREIEEGAIVKLREALNEGSGPEPQPEGAPGDLKIVARENVIVGNNNKVHLVTVYSAAGDDALTPERKQRLKGLVSDIVRVSKRSPRPTSHQAVWGRFQRNFRINTYHALPPPVFPEAEAYLKMLYARAKKGSL